MPKSDRLPELRPQIPSLNLRGLTLYELYARQERNDKNIKLLSGWLDEFWDINTYESLIECTKLKKKLIWAIRLKRLKIYLLSLVGRN